MQKLLNLRHTGIPILQIKLFCEIIKKYFVRHFFYLVNCNRATKVMSFNPLAILLGLLGVGGRPIENL